MSNKTQLKYEHYERTTETCKNSQQTTTTTRVHAARAKSNKIPQLSYYHFRHGLPETARRKLSVKAFFAIVLCLLKNVKILSGSVSYVFVPRAVLKMACNVTGWRSADNSVPSRPAYRSWLFSWSTSYKFLPLAFRQPEQKPKQSTESWRTFSVCPHLCQPAC